MIKVLLVDDQRLLAEGIEAVLLTSPDIKVCGIAADGEEALEYSAAYHPDVVLMDIRMPNMNGVSATKRLKDKYPDMKIVILTTFDDSDYILSALNNGASGYLLKDIGAGALIDAVKNAYEGDTILPSKIARKITDVAMRVTDDRKSRIREAFKLSEREFEVVSMIADGFTNKQIASAFKLSDGTVRNYISSVYAKLGVDNRNAAAKKFNSFE